MYNSNRGSVSNHYDSKVESHRGDRGYTRATDGDNEDHGDYRRSRDSEGTKGRRRNRWDDDERDSSSRSRESREYRRHWKDSRSRSPVDKQKSPSFRVRNDIFENNNEIKKEESYPKKRRNNWSDSSSDEDSGSGRIRRSNPPRADNSNGSHQRSSESFSAGNNGSSYSKQDFYQSQQSSGMAGDPKLVANLKSPATEIAKNASLGIQIRLLPQPAKSSPVVKPTVTKPKSTMKVASVFNVDDEDDEEEMPAECKMRMKNIGRETPTSAGPNSFGKTKIGFCNMATIKERRLQEDILKKK